MILTALVAFILAPPTVVPWQFYGTILCLSLLFVINILPDSLGHWFGTPKDALWVVLILEAVLYLLAFWMGASGFFSFIPFLMFLIIGQASYSLPIRSGSLFILLLMASTVLIVALTSGWENALSSIAGFVPGAFFTIVFTQLARRNAEQTEHANQLLAQLQQANAALASAAEREKDLAVAEERVRLARDIHDGLGHHMVVLNVQLQAAEKLIHRDPERALHAIQLCRQEAQLALDETRQSVSALRRTPLDGRTLDEALSSLVASFDERTALNARLEMRGSSNDLSPSQAMTIFRTAQEGLTNAQKHAQAQQVVVTFERQAAWIRLRVSDDGIGNSSGASGGFGLAGLRERAEQLGGHLQFGPGATGGSVLEVDLPLVVGENVTR
jgi:signal transduction histidine kinase